MKFYVLTDIEGVAGVARWDQTGLDTPGYPQAVRLFTEELRACIAGIQQADAQADIWVWDAHGCGSVDFERFPRGARMLNHGALPGGLFLDRGFDGLFFLGQHPKAGTPNGNLAHSYSSAAFEYIKLNGLELGEFGCRAALAGHYGVPTVFISGDDTAIAEARALVPGIYAAQVKTGLGPQTALHLAPEDARAVIHDTAVQAATHCREIAPYILPGPPYEQEIMLWAHGDPNDLLARGFTCAGPRRYVKTSDRLEDLLI